MLVASLLSDDVSSASAQPAPTASLSTTVTRGDPVLSQRAIPVPIIGFRLAEYERRILPSPRLCQDGRRLQTEFIKLRGRQTIRLRHTCMLSHERQFDRGRRCGPSGGLRFCYRVHKRKDGIGLLAVDRFGFPCGHGLYPFRRGVSSVSADGLGA